MQLCMRIKPLLLLTEQKLYAGGMEWSSVTGEVITVSQNYHKTSILQLHCLQVLTTIDVCILLGINTKITSQYAYLKLQNIHVNVQRIFIFVYFLSRKEGDNEFMNIIVNEINTQVRF